MDLPLHTCIFGPLKFDHWLHSHSHSHSHRQACPRHHHPFYRRDDVVSVARSLTGGANVPPEDPDVQQKLVDIIRLETGKVRVSDYIDERSKLLADIAEQAMVESDLIAADALRGLDEASAKTIKAVDKDIEAVEKQLASARAEMEARQEDLATFEKRMEAARSEGLFFKGLYKPLKQWKDRDSDEQEAIKNEVKNIAQTTKSLLGSKSRQNLYVFLIFVLGVFLLEGVASAEILWPRVIVLLAVIVFLSMQLIFEKFVSSGKDDTMER